MSRNRKRLSTLEAVMLVVIIVIPVLSPGAGAASKYKTLHKFSGGADGNVPSGVIFDRAGNLYGTTSLGGALGYGVVFELMPNSNGTWTESVLYQFMGGHDGAYPSSSLIFDGAGNLFGATAGGGDPEHCTVNSVDGCGVIFELMPNSNGTWTESALYQFTGGSDGAFPAAVIFDGAGNLYGTTPVGGALGYGVVFELMPNSNGTWTEIVLRSFTRKGPFPGSLIFDAIGNLDGTSGGDGSPGAAFQLTPTSTGGWTYHLLHRFTGGNDGSTPNGPLIFDSAGNLYGTTGGGGVYGYGNVFRLTPDSNGGWTEHVLHQFTGGKQGAQPAAGLTHDATGNLYGTTYYGGNLSNCSSGCGVAFELTPNSNGGWKEIVLHTFLDHPGAHPAAGLVLDTTGNLYGTSVGDSTTTFGSVFEIAR
jgi:uncharacterized repeat protein (TIGR03803 family)